MICDLPIKSFWFILTHNNYWSFKATQHQWECAMTNTTRALYYRSVVCGLPTNATINGGGRINTWSQITQTIKTPRISANTWHNGPACAVLLKRAQKLIIDYFMTIQKWLREPIRLWKQTLCLESLKTQCFTIDFM